MNISHHENNWIEFSARKQTYILRLGQPEYYFTTKGKNETHIVPSQVPPIHQPSGHSKSYDNNYNNMFIIIIRYLPMCTHCL